MGGVSGNHEIVTLFFFPQTFPLARRESSWVELPWPNTAPTARLRLAQWQSARPPSARSSTRSMAPGPETGSRVGARRTGFRAPCCSPPAAPLRPEWPTTVPSGGSGCGPQLSTLCCQPCGQSPGPLSVATGGRAPSAIARQDGHSCHSGLKEVACHRCTPVLPAQCGPRWLGRGRQTTLGESPVSVRRPPRQTRICRGRPARSPLRGRHGLERNRLCRAAAPCGARGWLAAMHT